MAYVAGRDIKLNPPLHYLSLFDSWLGQKAEVLPRRLLRYVRLSSISTSEIESPIQLRSIVSLSKLVNYGEIYGPCVVFQTNEYL